MTNPTTQSLFDGHADGEGSSKDPRLAKQIVRVYQCMKSSHWMLLKEIAQGAQAPEASVSARIRDLRKPRFGNFVIEQRHWSNGLHMYKLFPTTGVEAYVYDPLPGPRSQKKEARERIEAFLKAYESTPAGYPGPIEWSSGEYLWADDIRTLLR